MGRRILVVDDSVVAAQQITAVLQAVGCEVVGHAKNGAEGLTLYNRLSGTREPRGNLDVSFKWEIFKDFYWSFSFYYTFDQQHETGAATTDYGSFVSLGWKL